MHELTLAQQLWETAEAEMAKSGAEQLVQIDVVVGEFSGVESQALLSALEMLLQNSPWPKAEVKMHSEPLRVRCESCGLEFGPEEMAFQCTGCGGDDVTIVSGRQIRLKSIDVE